MFNVTILKMKDILKYLIGILLTGMVIIFISKGLGKVSEDNSDGSNNVVQKVGKGISLFTENSMLQALDTTIPVIANVNEEYKNIAKEDNENDNNKDILQAMLGIQISSINGMENINENKEIEEAKKTEEENNSNEEENNVSNETDESKEVAVAGTQTEVITPNPISDGANTQIGSVKIKNGTDYQITEDMLNTSDLTIDNKNIILFHTHSCESYTSSEKYPYTPTGNFRTTDLNFTVTRVGTELETYLKGYNYNVVHSTDYHDYPAYNGSYTRSLKTVENILQTTPSDIIIDVHRDAIGSRSDYAPTVKIGDEEAAQLMFVIGTDNGGLWHPNWRENLKFAVAVQQKAEEMYPGLFKTMMLTKSRYNQHTGKYASIIEVGATGNTLEQCLTSMKYLAAVMHEVIK